MAVTHSIRIFFSSQDQMLFMQSHSALYDQKADLIYHCTEWITENQMWTDLQHQSHA